MNLTSRANGAVLGAAEGHDVHAGLPRHLKATTGYRSLVRTAVAAILRLTGNQAGVSPPGHLRRGAANGGDCVGEAGPWEKQALSARGFKRVRRHSEYAI